MAAGRARTWLAVEHAELYASLYAEHVAKARAQDPSGSATAVRNRARSRALGELQRRHYDDYRRRYEAELARAHADQQQADLEEATCSAEPHAPYWRQRRDQQQRHALAEQRAHVIARLRALLWLADQHPDTTTTLYRAQAARVPLNPADRTPERRRALAWAATLDLLARLHPGTFQARHRTELANLRGHRPTVDGERRPARHAR